MVRPGHDPIVKAKLGARFQIEMHRDRRVNGALCDRPAKKLAVLGVAPRTLAVMECLSAGSKFSEMRLCVYEKIPVLFVMNDSLIFRIEECGIADLVLVDPEVMVKKDANRTGISLAEIANANSAKEDVLVARDRVVT